MIEYTFIQTLSTLPYVEKIILFGSRARKNNIERADIDLAIVCPHATSSDWLEVLEIIENADTLLPIDCVRFDTLSQESKLKKNIINEGVILYSKILTLFSKLALAFKTLEEINQKKVTKNSFIIDAAIKRFRHTFELLWRFFREYFVINGIELHSPREVLRQALDRRIITNETIWFRLFKTHALLPHTYDKELADLVFTDIKNYVPVFRETVNYIKVDLLPKLGLITNQNL